LKRSQRETSFSLEFAPIKVLLFLKELCSAHFK
jgi:hypothetical protein